LGTCRSIRSSNDVSAHASRASAPGPHRHKSSRSPHETDFRVADQVWAVRHSHPTNHQRPSRWDARPGNGRVWARTLTSNGTGASSPSSVVVSLEDRKSCSCRCSARAWQDAAGHGIEARTDRRCHHLRRVSRREAEASNRSEANPATTRAGPCGTQRKPSTTYFIVRTRGKTDAVFPSSTAGA